MIASISESNVKKFLNPLSSLAIGSPSLDSKEKNEAIETLKEAKTFPPGFHLELGQVGQQRPPKPPMPFSLQQQQNFDSNENNQDVINRPQTDLTSALLVQLRSPYDQSKKKKNENPFSMH